MSKTVRFSAVALALCACLSTTPAAPAAPKPKVLIVTGDDVTPAHNWRQVSRATADILLAPGKLDVRVSEDPGILESASSLQRYDVVYLAMYNASTPTLTDQAKANLVNFVKGGKGFVVTHLSSASFKEWDEFKKLCGRYWVMGQSGHGPRATFTVKITDPKDPIMAGLQDFTADDELYAKLLGDAPIRVLAEADSDWSKKTEPLVFTFSYGQGRVFHHTFGHDGKALDNPSIKTIIQRGTQWAATGKAETPH